MIDDVLCVDAAAFCLSVLSLAGPWRKDLKIAKQRKRWKKKTRRKK